MTVPPRRVGEPMFGRRVLAVAALQGFSAFVAALAVHLWAVWGGQSDDVVRTVTFTTLAVGNVSLILVNRSWSLTVWRTFRERRNPARLPCPSY